METIAEETYSLPLYERPLRYTGLASDYTTDNDVPAEDETRGDPGESITITVSDVQNARDRVAVLHRRSGTTLGSYYFEVVDPEHQICVYTGDDPDEVPWPVRRGLERSGLHDRTSPDTPRKYVFDHLLTGAHMVGGYDVDAPLLNAWLTLLGAGTATFASFAALELQLPDSKFQELLEAYAEHADEMLAWEPEIDDHISEYFYDESDIEAPVYLPREDNYVWTDHAQQQGDAESDEPTTYVEVAKTTSSPEYVFAAHVSRYAIDRYRFVVTGDHTLIKEHGEHPDLPPYSIVRSLQEEGYHFGNVPTLDPDANISDIVERTDELVRWIRKRYELETRQTFAAYSRHITRLEAAMILSILYEADSREYHRKRKVAFAGLNTNLDDVSLENVRPEVLQQITMRFIREFDADTFSIAEDRLADMQYRERMEKYERRADALEDPSPSTFDVTLS